MAEGKFVISAQNRIKEGLDAAQRDLGSFTTAAENLGKKLEAAFTATAIVAGLKKLGEATFDCYKEFGEAERRLNTLKIALDNNDASIRRATSLIEGMSKMTLASKDDIEGLASELAELGKSDDEIEAITRASVNLSNVTGKDLNSAFTLVNATYSGTAGKLDKLIPQIGDLTKEQLAAGGATKIINEQFGELSQKISDNDIGQKLKNLNDSFGDLRENVGERTATFFTPIINGIQTIIDRWNEAYVAQKNNIILLEQGNYVKKIQAAKENIGFEENKISDIDRNLKPFLGKDGKVRPGLENDMTYRGLLIQKDVHKQNIATLEGMVTDYSKLISNYPAKFDETFKLGKFGPRTTTTGGAALSKSGVTTVADDNGWQAALQAWVNATYRGAMGQSGIAPAVREDPIEYIPQAVEKGVITGFENSELAMIFNPLEVALGELVTNLESTPQAIVQAITAGYETSNSELAMVLDPLAAALGNVVDAADEFRAAPPVVTYDATGGLMRDEMIAANQSFASYYPPAGERGGAAAFFNNGNGAVEASGVSNLSILDSIGSAFGDLVAGIGPLISSLSSIKMLLDPISVILQGFMSVIGPAINNVLQPIIGILIIISQYLGQMLTPVLEALATVTYKLAEVFVWLYNNVLVPVGIVIMGMFNALANSVIGIANAFIQIRNGIAWMFGGNQAALIAERSFDQGAPQRIEIGTVMAAGSSSMAATASESASYRTQSITINIYQNAAVVGQAGMTEFARIIRGEFVQLGYLGQ